jgi:hypothetical protein
LILAELAQGRRPSSDVKEAGAREGISARTMQRAAAELEVVIEDEATDSGRVTYWSLPDWLGGRDTPRLSQSGATPSTPLEHKDSGVASGGSCHDSETGDGATPSGCLEHPGGRFWRARDGVWRCLVCEPAALRSEILQVAP